MGSIKFSIAMTMRKFRISLVDASFQSMNVVKYQNSKVVDKTTREPCTDLKKKVPSTKGSAMPSTFADNCNFNLSG